MRLFFQVFLRSKSATPSLPSAVILSVLVQIIGTNITGELFIQVFGEHPADWMSEWRLPDFRNRHRNLWSAAIALTFIASIESLLSIKGMDTWTLISANSCEQRPVRSIATAVSGLFG